MSDLEYPRTNYEKMWESFNSYWFSSNPEEMDILWKEILDIARTGESGIDERRENCFLHMLVSKQDAPLSVSFFEALTPVSKKQSLVWCDYRNNEGNTVLMNASAYGRNELVDSILSFGCDLDQGDEEGNRPLLYAAGSGNVVGLKALLDAGACPNTANDEGRTPLMEVCKLGPGLKNAKAIEMLLAYGAHTHYEDDDRTALDLAQDSGHQAAFNLISRHNAALCADGLQKGTPPAPRKPRSHRL